MLRPTRDDVTEQLLALLPRGRAWQNHASVAVLSQQSVLKRFWRAVALPWTALETAICDAWDNMSCATAISDRDLWLEEYGLPDECDPFGDNLCGKAGSTGGTSTAYYAERIAALGYNVSLRWLKGFDPQFPGVTATLHAVIHPGTISSQPGMTVGNARVGVARLGEADIVRVICVLDRMIPAHVAITYEIAG